MWTFVIPFLALMAGVALLAVAVWFVVRTVDLVHRKAERRDRLDGKVQEFNADVTLEDLRRHRDRINEDQERMRRDRDASG